MLGDAFELCEGVVRERDADSRRTRAQHAVNLVRDVANLDRLHASETTGMRVSPQIAPNLVPELQGLRNRKSSHRTLLDAQPWVRRCLGAADAMRALLYAERFAPHVVLLDMAFSTSGMSQARGRATAPRR